MEWYDGLQTICDAIHDELGNWKVPVLGVIPNKRPEEFLTVERTGGQVTRYLDYGQYAIQLWGIGITGVEKRIPWVTTAIFGLERYPWCAGVEVGSAYNFPDPDSRHARYQVTATIITKDYMQYA